MSKSKYPNQLDTSVEIQPVRDNILEVGSDVINSLRSAIFNIERTLGINPQGGVGNTVAERISRSLDGNGNIKPDALSRANLLTGPIVDNDVSKVAAIKESKLKLDFPTQLLQDEISILNSQISEIISEIENLSTELSIHTNPASLNRHKAMAITVEGATSLGSDAAAVDLESGTLQESLESLYNSHINYTGVNLSIDNNSHSADQIYFDNTNVSSFISSNSVQGAIEDLATNSVTEDTLHQGIMHSNGILRAGLITRSNDSIGNVLVDSAVVTFSASNGSSPDYTVITINDTVSIADFILEKSDILTIFTSNGTLPSYVGNYEIVSYTSTGTILNTVTILANFTEGSSALTRARISKKIRDNINLGSLLVSIREEAGLTSARSAQICNPNAVRVISSGIRPYEITTTNRFFDISIDNNSPVTIDLYTPGVRQTIDTIVSKINEQCAEESLNFLSYRLDNEGESSEIILACNLPDLEADKHTITISRSTDSGIDAAGFGYIEDQLISSVYGSNYYILGKEYSGLSTKLNSSGLLFSPGSTVVNSGGSGLDFLQLGIKNFDILTISGSANSVDDGSYAISSVSASQITLSPNQLPTGFSGSNQSTTKFTIYRNIASFDAVTFDVVSPTFGASLFDIFMDQDQKIFIDKRFEWAVDLSAPISLLDFEGDVGDEQFTLNITQNTSYITLSLDSGPEVEVRGTDNYFWIRSGEKNVKFRLFLTDTTSIPSGGLVTTFYGYASVSNLTNLKLSRVQYNNYIGRVGSRVVNILPRGNVSDKEISTTAVRNLVSGPRSELRSNGVINGLEITNVVGTGNLYTFDIGSGICYVNGRRFEIPERLNFITDIDSTVNDKIFIAVDENGNIIVEPTTPSCSVPFESLEVCVLGTVEFSTPNFYVIDLRLFIDNLDLKVLNAITVSPQPGMAHFSDLGKAIKYAKRFSQIFPKAGVPTVHLKSGIYYITNEYDETDKTFATWNVIFGSTPEVIYEKVINTSIESGLVIDFPVNIVGEGDSTELVLRDKYFYSGNDIKIYKGALIIVGDGYTPSFFGNKITSGNITISNLKMNNSKILFFDLNIYSPTSDKYPFSINIDNINFDNQNFDTPNPIDNVNTMGSIYFIELFDTLVSKGNVSINNCRFLPDASVTTGYSIFIANAFRIKNLSITNNKLYNSAHPNTAFINEDIITNDKVDASANILVWGNLSYGSDLPSGFRSVIYSGSNSWIDRISRDVYIGNNLTVAENITSNKFNFSSTKIGQKTFLWDYVTGYYGGASAVPPATFVTVSDPSYGYWRAAQVFPFAAHMRIDAPIGSTITTIEIGTSASSNYDWTITLIRQKMDGTASSTIGSFGPVTSVNSGAGPFKKAIFTSIGLNIVAGSLYSIKIEHNQAAPLMHLYTKVSYQGTDIEDLIGIS